MPSLAHRCHFPRCTTPTPRKHLYCLMHWRMVPAPIRTHVWIAYDKLPHGPEGNCLRVSQEWIDATNAAEEAIKESIRRRNDKAAEKEEAALREPTFEFGS